MQDYTFSNLETQIFNLLHEGKNTFEEMQQHSSMKDMILVETLESLRTKNIITSEKGVYKFATKIEGSILILEGNVLLPTTVLRPGDGFTYISRGMWYKFEDEILDDGTVKPFDIRRVMWNTVVEEKTNSTLVDMLRSHILRKEKQNIGVHENNEALKDKLFDYEKDYIRIKIMQVGTEITQIRIIFVLNIEIDKYSSIPFHGFFVESYVKTDELLDTLTIKPSERVPRETLKLIAVHRFSDFILNGNKIPIELKENGLIYMQINIKKKLIELQTYFLSNLGETTPLETEEFEDNIEAVKRLREVFEKFPTVVLNNVNMDVELLS